MVQNRPRFLSCSGLPAKGAADACDTGDTGTMGPPARRGRAPRRGAGAGVLLRRRLGGTRRGRPATARGRGRVGGNGFTTGAGGGTVACDIPCQAEEICSHGTCVPLVPCTTDDDCSNDTYCDPEVGCVPWDGAVPPHDESCINVIAAGIFSPRVKCEFSAAPQGTRSRGTWTSRGRRSSSTSTCRRCPGRRASPRRSPRPWSATTPRTSA